MSNASSIVILTNEKGLRPCETTVTKRNMFVWITLYNETWLEVSAEKSKTKTETLSFQPQAIQNNHNFQSFAPAETCLWAIYVNL